MAVRGGRARHADAASGAHRAREAGQWLPRRAAETPARAVAPRPHLVGWRQRVEVMAQVARGRQERRCPVLVAAVARNRRERGDGCLELGVILGRELKGAQPRVVLDVRALAQPRADDHRRHAPLLHDEARGHVGERHAVTIGHRPCRTQHALQRRPAAGRADEAPVLHLRPGARAFPVGLVLPQPRVAEPAAAHRAVGEQAHAVFGAHGGEPAGGAAVDERAAHLVRHDLDATGEHQAQMRGIHIREPQMADAPLVLQVLQVEQRVEPRRVGVVPGVELQQVDRLRAQTRERPFNRGTYVGGSHRPRCRHPLREELHAIGIAGGPALPRNELGRAVVVGHVERREPGLHVRRHGSGRGVEVEHASVTLHVGDLPQAGDHARDRQAGRKSHTLRGQQGHLDHLQLTLRAGRSVAGLYSGGKAANRAATSTPCARKRRISRR